MWPVSRRNCGNLGATVLVAVWVGAPGAVAGQASEWAVSSHSAARLIDAGPRQGGASGGSRLVGLEIRLDPSFITYWRSPGEAGVPPVFDVTASDNLRSAEVLYPAPRRFDEDGLAAFGYDARVTFPILVEAQDPARPTTMAVAVDYAVCAKICLPAKARLRLRLGGGASPDAPTVESALRDVPQPRRLGQAGEIRIDGIEGTPDGATVTATTPDGAGSLFVEGPDSWYAAAASPHNLGDGHLSFALTFPDHPHGPIPPEPLRLTLVASDRAIEVSVPLDEALSKP